MNKEPKCPKCSGEYTYEDRGMWVCPDCSHEWSTNAAMSSDEGNEHCDDNVRDANGNVLVDGDTVTVIKDLKVKGSSSSLKVGTKVKNIKVLKDSADGHNIACRIDGFGAMNLKSEFVKKV